MQHIKLKKTYVAECVSIHYDSGWHKLLKVRQNKMLARARLFLDLNLQKKVQTDASS